MEKLKMELEKTREMKKSLMGMVEAEIACGREAVCKGIEGFGQLVDAVKDMAEIEEKCAKTCYYETVVEAMKKKEKEGLEDGGPYGYDNWRYSSGRFAPTGKGHYAGYTPYPFMYMDDTQKIMNEYMMGYSGSGRGDSGSRGGSSRDSSGRGANNSSSYGYQPMGSKRGISYDRWDDARKYYHETGSQEAKGQMDHEMTEHVSEVLSQLKEMNQEASPEMRKELRSKVSKLMEDMGRTV